MSKTFQITLTVTKYISWSEYEKKKQNKEFKKKIDGARIYYIIGKTDELEKILYIGSTKQNITTRIKFNHRGFVKALRNGWDEEDLGLSFGYYEEHLVLPKEVEGYLINKYKPIFNASTPDFKVISSVNEIGSFDLPKFFSIGSSLIDKNGSKVPMENRISTSDVDIEWIRYLENLPIDNSDQACLNCNKLIDDTASAFITDFIRFSIEYQYHRKSRFAKRGPEGVLKLFSLYNSRVVYKTSNEGHLKATNHFQVPISYISKEYQHRLIHKFCNPCSGKLKEQFLRSLPSDGSLRYDKYVELMENRKKLDRVQSEAEKLTIKKFSRSRLIELNKEAINPYYYVLVKAREAIKERNKEREKQVRDRKKLQNKYEKDHEKGLEKYNNDLEKYNKANEPAFYARKYWKSSKFSRIFMNKPEEPYLSNKNEIQIPDPPTKPTLPQIGDISEREELPPVPKKVHYLSPNIQTKNRSIAEAEIKEKLRNMINQTNKSDIKEDKILQFYLKTLNELESFYTKSIKYLREEVIL